MQHPLCGSCYWFEQYPQRKEGLCRLEPLPLNTYSDSFCSHHSDLQASADEQDQRFQRLVDAVDALAAVLASRLP